MWRPWWRAGFPHQNWVPLERRLTDVNLWVRGDARPVLAKDRRDGYKVRIPNCYSHEERHATRRL